jgi:Predicted membrane protein
VEAGEGAVSRDTRIFALCLGALALIILGASTLTTVAIAHGASPSLRLPFLLMCHGIPHRCLTILGTPMPICARCVGIYGGFLVSLVAFPIVMKTADSRQRTAGRPIAIPSAASIAKSGA